MLLKILIDIKMFSLEIITITLLIIFELLFSKHFEIGLNNNAKEISNIFEENLYIMIDIKTFGLIIIHNISYDT